MRNSRVMESVLHRIESAEGLDRAADLLSGLLRRVIRPGPVEDALSGTPLGHPLHPVLVAVPIGAWTSASIMDACGNRDAARALVVTGLVSVLPTAASGASDWLSTEGAERRVGLVHALLNYAAIGLYVASWRSRASGSHARGVALSAAGAGVLGVGGWLGGHLAFAQGVGVDTTAFQQFPTEWTDAIGVDEAPDAGAFTHVEVAGIPVLLVGGASGVTALADRCTHRGGPLHEGELVDGCIVCPWHGAAFSVDDGLVASGPATRPQPMFQTRVHGSRIQLRRPEVRTLRTNPIGR